MTEFYKLPKDIAARRDLRPSDKLIYAVVLNCFNGKNVCWPGKRYLMRRTGLADKTVCEAIHRLEDAGVLIVERRGIGRSTCFRLPCESGSGSEPVQGVNHSGSGSEPQVVQRVNHIRSNKRTIKRTRAGARKTSRAAGKKFTPPTLADIKTYVDAKGLSVDPKFFLDYFTESGWIDSRGNPVKNWKQKLLTWDSHRQKRQSQKTPTAETEDHEARYITDPETVERIYREVGLC
jgi:hypothetical protein